jgi:integrase
MRKPKEPAHRDVTISRSEIRKMLVSLGHKRGPCKRSSQAVARAFLLALRTGMRAGEITKLTWDRVHDDYCVLPVTKTVPRDVPLEPKARRVVESMQGWDDDTVFGLSPQTLDALFRRYRDRAGLSGFRFHDARHTAATWMARRLDVLTLCKVFGWKATTQALVYYNPTASDIARMLTRPSAQAPGRSR